MDDLLALSDFRRRVATNYVRARHRGGAEAAWLGWRLERDELFGTHSQSPVPEGRRDGFTGMDFFPYDPSWRLEAVVESAPEHTGEAPHEVVSGPDGTFLRIGTVVADRGDDELRLPLLWLQGYGGGLFLPFRDATNGVETYGGGRYLLDQAKGADLGATSDGRLVLDFNYAYHPSCAHHPRWTCPLAPPDAVVPIPVKAGEMDPGGR